MTTQDYEKFISTLNGPNMQSLLTRLEQMKDTNTDLGDVLLAALGLPGEVGEVVDILKKWVFSGKTLDLTHLKKEMGDVMWYFTLLGISFGFSLDDIMEQNAEKLKARFPNGFNYHDANHRKPEDI